MIVRVTRRWLRIDLDIEGEAKKEIPVFGHRIPTLFINIATGIFGAVGKDSPQVMPGECFGWIRIHTAHIINVISECFTWSPLKPKTNLFRHIHFDPNPERNRNLCELISFGFAFGSQRLQVNPIIVVIGARFKVEYPNA